MNRADRNPTTDRGIRTRPRVRQRDHPGRHRVAIEHERTMPVFDLGHHRDLIVERLPIQPMRAQRHAPDHIGPYVEVLEGPHRLVFGARDQANTPGSVIGRKGQHRNGAVFLKQRPERHRHRTIIRTKMPPVVHEPAISAVLDRWLRANVRQPGGKHRTATGRVDYQIRPHILTGVSVHTNDVRDSCCGRIAGQQANDTDPSSNFEIVRRRDYLRDCGFRHRATRGHGVVALVSLAEATRHLRRCVTKWIHDQRTRIQERCDHVRDVRIHQLPIAGLEEVQQAELIHASPLPPLPGSLRIRGRRRIPFQDRDLMAVTSQHQRSAQPYDPPTNHNDPSHPILLVRALNLDQR